MLPHSPSTPVIDPVHDARVKKIETTYAKFLQVLEVLSKKQQQVITDALAELNQKQIQDIHGTSSSN